MSTQPDAPTEGHATHYSDTGFWSKLAKYALAAGREIVEKALWLYYAAERPETPAWAKAAIYGALGYFIFPIDAIPDITPMVGYVDDLGVITFALSTVASYIDDNVKAQSASKLKDWFGEA